jgi:hypothetical protein
MEENTKEQGLSILDVIGITVLVIGCMLVSAPLILLKHIIGEDAAMLLYYVVSMGMALMYIHRGKSLRSYIIRFDKPLIMLLLVTAILGLQFGISIPIISTIPMPDFIREMFLRMSQTEGIFGLITIIVAAPIIEELIFRGIILEGLLQRYSPMKSILISALFFGIVHLNPWQFISGFLGGILMGWVYCRTRNLLLPMFLHFINNLTFTLISKAMGPEAAIDFKLQDFYGGTTSLILAIVGAVIVGGLSMYYLNGMMKIREKPVLESTDIV